MAWTPESLDRAFAPYFAEHDDVVVAPDARGPTLFQLDDTADATWLLRQVLLDPEGHKEWVVVVRIDLASSAEAGEIQASFQGVRRL